MIFDLKSGAAVHEHTQESESGWRVRDAEEKDELCEGIKKTNTRGS